MKDIDLCRVFNNLFKNAYEASLKVKNKEKCFITIKSRMQSNWLIISCKNHYCDKIVEANRVLLTTKEDNEHHGMGITNIKQIVARYNGFCEIDADNRKEIFAFLIYIPIHQIEDK